MNLLKHMPVKYFDHYMLRPIKKRDYKDMFEYGKSKDVCQYLTWGPMFHISEAKKSIKSIFLTRPKKGIPVGYAIVDTDVNKMIGTIDFHTKIEYQNVVEIGYVLNQSYWSKHIMSQALKIVTEVGFEVYHYDKIIIKHLKNNIASGKVITNNGYKFKNSYAYHYDKITQVLSSEMMVYELTKENYDENKSR